MENKILNCIVLTPEQYQKLKIKGTYFENSAVIEESGIYTFCCLETIIQSLVEHLNDNTITLAHNGITKDHQTNIYVFEDNTNQMKTIIQIPEKLKYCRFEFIKKDTKELDKLVTLSKNINEKKETLKRIKTIIEIITILASIGIIKLSTDNPKTRIRPLKNVKQIIYETDEYNENNEEIEKQLKLTQYYK